MAMNDPQRYYRYGEAAGQIVREILPEMKEHMTDWDEEYVLDVGCATGINTSRNLTAFLPNATIIGSDLSEQMIEFAKKTHTTDKLTFRVLDITDSSAWISQCKEKFTKVFSFYTMHRVVNPRKAYENIYNLLKPGGELITVTPVANCMECILPYLAKMPKYSKYSEQLAKMNVFINPTDDYKNSTVDILKSVGFEVKFAEHANKSFCAPSIDYLVEFYGLVSYLSHVLPSNLFQESLIDAKKIIEENDLIEQAHGGYLQKYIVLALVARKPK
ncbi:hypothetical protein O3M35_007089 [Rhynocoris fuscipes]|uniref:Methyltransferase domain-containing protein n=1 Tax=Rhynocoris fuscipes TaxID=488301 RepID=A0AAW1D883_9HEMI